jgi:hypothetical protein
MKDRGRGKDELRKAKTEMKVVSSEAEDDDVNIFLSSMKKLRLSK